MPVGKKDINKILDPTGCQGFVISCETNGALDVTPLVLLPMDAIRSFGTGVLPQQLPRASSLDDTKPHPGYTCIWPDHKEVFGKIDQTCIIDHPCLFHCLLRLKMTIKRAYQTAGIYQIDLKQIPQHSTATSCFRY